MSDSYYDYFPVYPAPNEPEKDKPKCTCGVSITMGKDDDIKFHSEWCELKGNKKDESIKDRNTI